MVPVLSHIICIAFNRLNIRYCLRHILGKININICMKLVKKTFYLLSTLLLTKVRAISDIGVIDISGEKMQGK